MAVLQWRMRQKAADEQAVDRLLQRIAMGRLVTEGARRTALLSLVRRVRTDERNLVTRHGSAGVRGPDAAPRKQRPSPVRDGLRPSREKPRAVVRTELVAYRKANGLCVPCGDPAVTKTMCARCAARHAMRNRALRRNLKQGAA